MRLKTCKTQHKNALTAQGALHEFINETIEEVVTTTYEHKKQQ